MSASVNKVILVGNLGRDPEIRFSQSGDKIANFSMATSESWKDRQSGERRERTEWHRVVVFNAALADVAERFLRKGSKVYIEGQLQTRKWTGNDGVERYTTEVVIPRFRGDITMLDSKGAGGPPPSEDPDGYGTTTTRDDGRDEQAPAPQSDLPAADADFDDEIPF